MTNGPEFERLESHLRGSWLVRTIDVSAAAWRVAATRSAIVRALRRAITQFSSLTPAERLRAVAVFVTTAAGRRSDTAPIRAAGYRPHPAEGDVGARRGGGVGHRFLFLNALLPGWESSFVSRIWRVQLSRRSSGL
jgi:hypothetical protein